MPGNGNTDTLISTGDAVEAALAVLSDPNNDVQRILHYELPPDGSSSSDLYTNVVNLVSEYPNGISPEQLAEELQAKLAPYKLPPHNVSEIKCEYIISQTYNILGIETGTDAPVQQQTSTTNHAPNNAPTNQSEVIVVSVEVENVEEIPSKVSTPTILSIEDATEILGYAIDDFGTGASIYAEILHQIHDTLSSKYQEGITPDQLILELINAIFEVEHELNASLGENDPDIFIHRDDAVDLINQVADFDFPITDQEQANIEALQTQFAIPMLGMPVFEGDVFGEFLKTLSLEEQRTIFSSLLESEKGQLKYWFLGQVEGLDLLLIDESILQDLGIATDHLPSHLRTAIDYLRGWQPDIELQLLNQLSEKIEQLPEIIEIAGQVISIAEGRKHFLDYHNKMMKRRSLLFSLQHQLEPELKQLQAQLSEEDEDGFDLEGWLINAGIAIANAPGDLAEEIGLGEEFDEFVADLVLANFGTSIEALGAFSNTELAEAIRANPDIALAVATGALILVPVVLSGGLVALVAVAGTTAKATVYTGMTMGVGDMGYQLLTTGKVDWSHVKQTSLDWAQLGAEVGFSWATGLQYGNWFSQLGMTGKSAWGAMAATDVAYGVSMDMALRGDSFSQAMLYNMLFFGAGEFVGYGGGKLLLPIGDSLATWGTVASDVNLSRRIAQMIRNGEKVTPEVMEELLRNRDFIGRLSQQWLDSRNLMLLYRGQTKHTDRILSWTARERSIAESDALYTALADSGLSSSEIAGLTAHYGFDPSTGRAVNLSWSTVQEDLGREAALPIIGGIPVSRYEFGGAGIPTTRIPAVASGFMHNQPSGSFYIISIPKSQVLTNPYLPSFPGPAFAGIEKEHIIITVIPPENIIAELKNGRNLRWALGLRDNEAGIVAEGGPINAWLNFIYR